jgi:hypothetical protein
MNRRTASLLGCGLIAASPAFAAEVTSERLVNADREPENWLDEPSHLRCAALLTARQDQ